VEGSATEHIDAEEERTSSESRLQGPSARLKAGEQPSAVASARLEAGEQPPAVDACDVRTSPSNRTVPPKWELARQEPPTEES